MTMTLSKAGNLGHSASQLCQVPWARHSVKKIQKNCFAECLPTALGKENPKNRKQALPSARCRHSTKHLKKTHFFAVTVTWLSQRLFFTECRRGTRKILCRVPDMRHSANKPLLWRDMPTALCRVQHLAKALPSAKPSLPSAIALGKARVCCSLWKGSIC